MTACSSDQNEEAGGVSGKTGTFEIGINFADPGAETRVSTAKPTTSWSNISQVQFFLYDASGKVAWSAIETPATGASVGTGKKYSYATVPAASYTLVAVANAQNSATYIAGTAQAWSPVASVFNRSLSTLDIRHKAAAGWPASVTSSASDVSSLTAYDAPSEVFMGYASVTISSNAVSTATVDLKREVSLLRARIDQTTHAGVVANVDFTAPNAGIFIYNLPERMGISYGTAGGVLGDSFKGNVISAPGAFSTTASDASGTYLETPYTSWKEVVVFPNNGGRANNSNTTAEAANGKKYFIVVCGVAKANHYYAGGTPATVGASVFWYGQIEEVFTPNVIREVNVLLKTGGSPILPPNIVEYGGLDITVNSPIPWGSIVVTDPIEM